MHCQPCSSTRGGRCHPLPSGCDCVPARSLSSVPPAPPRYRRHLGTSSPIIWFAASIAMWCAAASGCAGAPRVGVESALLSPHNPTATAATQPAIAASGLHVLHPYLASRLDSLEARSPHFAAALERLRSAPFPVLVGTPEQVAGVTPWGRLLSYRFRPARVGEFAAVAASDGERVGAMYVSISLERLAARAARRGRSARGGTDPEELEAFFAEHVDAVLIHEIWGHVVPIADSGRLDSHCEDPHPGQDPLGSCVMQRENDLRREMGLEPRTTYPLRLRPSHHHPVPTRRSPRK
jgi:hypothetical protein